MTSHGVFQLPAINLKCKNLAVTKFRPLLIDVEEGSAAYLSFLRQVSTSIADCLMTQVASSMGAPSD